MTQNAQPILEVRNLKQYFPITTGFFKTTMLKAVDDISFTIHRGETLGLVGESGCGKTTAGRTILHLYKPTSGEDHLRRQVRRYRARCTNTAAARRWFSRIRTPR